MPLSTAHPAIVLPFCKGSKKWVSSTALIIGSITPDIEYLYHLLPNRTFSHNYYHAWWFDLIITLCLAFLFHHIIRNPLINNLPPFLSQRFQQFKPFHWVAHFIKHCPIIIISAWIGIYSHIIWDDFTHKGSYIVESFSFFHIHVTTFFGMDIVVHNLLQQISSIGGTIVVFAVLLSFKRNIDSHYNPRWIIFWIYVSIITIALVAIKFWMISNVFKPSVHYFVMLALTLVSSLLVGIVITCFFFSLSSKKAFRK